MTTCQVDVSALPRVQDPGLAMIRHETMDCFMLVRFTCMVSEVGKILLGRWMKRSVPERRSGIVAIKFSNIEMEVDRAKRATITWKSFALKWR